MPSKKKPSTQKTESSLTKDFLVDQLQNFETKISKNIDSKIEYARKLLESKIEYSRKDAKEQVLAIEERLTRKIESIHADLKYTQLAVKEVKNDTVRIERKLDRVVEEVKEHGEEIANLKSSALPT